MECIKNHADLDRGKFGKATVYTTLSPPGKDVYFQCNCPLAALLVACESCRRRTATSKARSCPASLQHHWSPGI
jgi:hypothetical protein